MACSRESSTILLPVEYCQWHGHVRDDGPCPQPVEVQLDRMGLGPRLLQGVDGPHGQVSDQQEGHQLASWLTTDLVWRHARSSRRVEHEHRLGRRLQERRQRRDQHQHCVLLDRKVAADDGESAVYEQTCLRADQQNVVQLQVAATVVLELPHLQTLAELSARAQPRGRLPPALHTYTYTHTKTHTHRDTNTHTDTHTETHTHRDTHTQ